MAWRFGVWVWGFRGFGFGTKGFSGMGLIFPPGSEGLGLGEENEDNK